MWNRRRNWILRRLVLGLAVAAVAAPTALANVEGGGGKSGNGATVVIQGDDKVLAPEGGNSLVIKGDDKVFATEGGNGLVIHGDDKQFAPEGGGNGVLVKGDDKEFPSAMGQYSQYGYRHALPADFAPISGDGILVGDDKQLPSANWQYGRYGYIQPLPSDYPTAATLVTDDATTHGRPAGRQVPVAVTGTGTDFNWGDGLVGAAAALGLAALAFGAARSTRMGRPTTA